MLKHTYTHTPAYTQAYTLPLSLTLTQLRKHTTKTQWLRKSPQTWLPWLPCALYGILSPLSCATDRELQKERDLHTHTATCTANTRTHTHAHMHIQLDKCV